MMIDSPWRRILFVLLGTIGSWFILVGPLAALPLPLGESRGQQAPHTTGSISGTVTSEVGDPLPTISVILSQNGQWLAETQTDATGHYTLTNIPPGDYQVGFWDVSGAFAPEYYDNVSALWQASTVNVSVGATTPNINAILAPGPSGGRIIGRVTTAGGVPLPNINVTLYYSSTSGWSSQFTVATDEAGRYAVGGLATGLWRVHFYDSSGNYAFAYYPNVTTLAAATDINVIGNTRAGIDAVLAPGGALTGTLLGPDNNPLSYGVVFVSLHNDPESREAASTSVDYGGHYMLRGLPSGSYRVRFYGQFDGREYHEWYANVTDPALATPVAVTAGMTTTAINASFDWPPLSRLIGTVRDTLGTPLPNINVSLYISPSEWSNWYPIQYVSTDASGVYTTTVYNPGIYALGFTSPSGDLAFEYYNNSTSPATATPFSLSLGITLTSLDVMLEPAGHITGVILGPNGNPPQWFDSASVSAWLHDGSQWQIVGNTSVDSLGNYAFHGLAAAVYRIQFHGSFDQASYEEWYDNALDAQLATPLTVTNGVTLPNINAQFDPHPSSLITGTVRDTNGNPLPSIQGTVYITNGWWYGVKSFHTDPAGVYSVTLYNPGIYTLGFADPSGLFAPEYYDNVHTLAAATPLSLSLGMTLTNIDVALAPAGHITGVVEMFGGQPVSGIYISAMNEDGTTAASTSLGSGGMYDLGGLGPGNYRVLFQAYFGNVWYYEWYDNVSDPNQATLITVGAGATVPAINAVLGGECGPHGTGRISGQVTGAGGVPLAGVRVKLYQLYGDSFWWYLVYADTDANGHYSIGCLNDSAYRVGFIDPQGAYASEFYSATADLESATTISIVNGTVVTGIDAALKGAGAITGEVTANSAPVAGVSVWAYRHNGAQWTPLGHATTNASGVYTVGSLYEGPYAVFFAPPTQMNLRPEYYLDAATVISATPVTVISNTITTGIDAQLSPRRPPPPASLQTEASPTTPIPGRRRSPCLRATLRV